VGYTTGSREEVPGERKPMIRGDGYDDDNNINVTKLWFSEIFMNPTHQQLQNGDLKIFEVIRQLIQKSKILYEGISLSEHVRSNNMGVK
jgi:dTDP-4-amino-4,6-dideoxygalactose transaminase